jgi:hypothetical protein
VHARNGALQVLDQVGIPVWCVDVEHKIGMRRQFSAYQLAESAEILCFGMNITCARARRALRSPRSGGLYAS